MKTPNSKLQTPKYPRHPERMKRCMERMANLGIIGKIPAALVLECKCTLRAYYGGRWRTVWTMFVEAVRETAAGTYWHLVYRFCDWVGWTKLIPLPPKEYGEKVFRRHGAKCPWNCHDLDCISKAVPRWFQKLTRWHDEDL